MTHYWVETPSVHVSYGYYEPPDEGPIVECVEAQTKTAAKLAFVRQQREEFKKNMMNGWNWFYHLSPNENPFNGLKATSCVCVHGNCNCEFIDTCPNRQLDDPNSDYCRYCTREEDMKVGPKTKAHIDSCEQCKNFDKCEERWKVIDDEYFNSRSLSESV